MPNTCIYLFSFLARSQNNRYLWSFLSLLNNKDYILTIRIYLYFYFCHEKFLWWGISLYFSISLQVAAFAQSNLSNISFNQPLKYRMDYIDPRFKLTKEQFIQIGKEAAEIWQKETGKTYFIYDSQAELTINLVLDNQQATQNERKIV